MITHQRSIFVVALVAVSFLSTSNSLLAGDAEAFAHRDVNDDGVLSGKEAAAFVQFDADGDGEVTKTEYTAGVAKLRKQLLEIPDDKLFADYDKNEDSVLSGTEMIALEVYDADGDGELSINELKAGRDAERKPAGPSRDELLRQFRELDKNEDGRLSGKELAGYEKLDRNGDRRVTEQEFLEGDAPAPQAGDPLAIFLRMIRSSDSTEFFDTAHPSFLIELDRPIINFFLAQVSIALGELSKTPPEVMAPTTQEEGGLVLTYHRMELPFSITKAKATVMVLENRLAGFYIESPLLKEFDQLLFQATESNPKVAKELAEYYARKCETLIRVILSGDDDKAFAAYHPEAQKQIDREKAGEIYQLLRELCGEFQSSKLVGIAVNSDDKGKGQSFSVTLIVSGSKGRAEFIAKLEALGFKAHLSGIRVKQPTASDSTAPPPSPFAKPPTPAIKMPAIPAKPSAPPPPPPPPAPAPVNKN